MPFETVIFCPFAVMQRGFFVDFSPISKGMPFEKAKEREKNESVMGTSL